MELLEFKFLLTLLGCPDYRSPLQKLQFDRDLPAAKRDQICRQLCDRDLVDCSYDIIEFKASPAGRALLKLKQKPATVSDRDLQTLLACSTTVLTPAKLRTIPAASRQAVLKSLADRGLIETETKIKEVWLAERGWQYLRDDYLATGTKAALARPVLSQEMLNAYITFLRKAFRDSSAVTISGNGSNRQVELATIDAQTLLEAIRQLDQELGSENYLPIFHLRQKFQPPLTREALDQLLYQLQRQDKIELGVLQEAIAYTPEQLEAGIPQDIGGPLFFISLN